MIRVMWGPRLRGPGSTRHVEISCFRSAIVMRTLTNLSHSLRVHVGDSWVVGSTGVMILCSPSKKGCTSCTCAMLALVIPWTSRRAWKPTCHECASSMHHIICVEACLILLTYRSSCYAVVLAMCLPHAPRDPDYGRGKECNIGLV